MHSTLDLRTRRAKFVPELAREGAPLHLEDRARAHILERVLRGEAELANRATERTTRMVREKTNLETGDEVRNKLAKRSLVRDGPGNSLERRRRRRSARVLPHNKM